MVTAQPGGCGAAGPGAGSEPESDSGAGAGSASGGAGAAPVAGPLAKSQPQISQKAMPGVSRGAPQEGQCSTADRLDEPDELDEPENGPESAAAEEAEAAGIFAPHSEQ